MKYQSTSSSSRSGRDLAEASGYTSMKRWPMKGRLAASSASSTSPQTGTV
jgi:hypothetical protein